MKLWGQSVYPSLSFFTLLIRSNTTNLSIFLLQRMLYSTYVQQTKRSGVNPSLQLCAPNTIHTIFYYFNTQLPNTYILSRSVNGEHYNLQSIFTSSALFKYHFLILKLNITQSIVDSRASVILKHRVSACQRGWVNTYKQRE